MSNLFTHNVSIYLQEIQFLFTSKINLKKKTLDFIKRILIEFEFVKKKKFQFDLLLKKKWFWFTLYLKKKKTRFHNYKETSILFFEKWFLQGKRDLFNLITRTKFQFIKKTNFYNFYFL